MNKYLKLIMDTLESNMVALVIIVSMLAIGGWMYWRREGLETMNELEEAGEKEVDVEEEVEEEDNADESK